MRHVRVALVAGLLVLLATGCGGEGDRSDGPDGNGPEEAAATEGTQALATEKEVRSSTGGASGGLVETCDGGSIRLNATEERLLQLHNEAREQRGLEPLCLQPTLTEAARAHSEDMIEKDYFAHVSPSGETLGERLKRFGYTPEGYGYWKVGGNIAWHSGPEAKPEEMFEGWMDSSGHRANILDEDFRQIGIGTHSGEYEGYEESVMYTADFGVRQR